MLKKILLIVFLATTLAHTSRGWVYPEHRDITLAAIQKLDSAHRALLNRLWALARTGYESRLDESVADMTQGEHPKYLDYAAFPAISGDHSTSAENLLFNVLHTDWILNVADITARLKTGLAGSTSKSERSGQLRDSDLRLLRADPEYVTRAGSNNVHFMLARPGVNTSAGAYFDSCSIEGCEINLIGTYKWFHASAIKKARRLSGETLTSEQRASLTLSALADEAFALHFLEDAFSAGHVAGVWGNAALRKGTHDYYDENGLEVTTWQGERLILTGDAYMRPEDAERAARTVMISLKQLLDAADQKSSPSVFSADPIVFTADTFNISKAIKMPFQQPDPAFRELTDALLMTTPVPGLASGLGEIPRFRSELGPFIGIAPAGRVSIISGAFGPSQLTAGMVPSLEVALHIGLGMDGVLNQSGDGLVFLDLGWRLDGASSIKLARDPSYNYFGSILAAVPSRDAFYTRLRLPFYVIPGDLFILGPLLLLVSPKAMNNVIATAGAGGLIPWQTGMITPIGRFQFILGREVGVCFYGSVDGADSFLIPYDIDGSTELALVSMRTTHFEFPVLEYRPVRTFSRRQSASLVLQISAGMDIPGKVTMLEPTNIGTIPLKTTWFVGFRLAFDWRYYYARKKQTSKVAH
ncbi:MAG: hypothetical protein NTW16_16555 [Bacteroidetes bacterium]|nr:hypothetical protein [Bacteroidota bacterium]